jgi:hypothetical protein
MKLSKAELEGLIDEGAKLAAALAPLEWKRKRLDEIKAIFREYAGAEDLKMSTTAGSTVTVDQKNDATARVVVSKVLASIIRICGANLFDLFTLHPSKGEAGNFELNAHNCLPKAKALELIKALRVKASAWVSFS